ncbi:CDP-glycerol glycerophosphotransferase family protein [Flavobacterium sp. ST-87]|uniref:CDP-glycerol glycerophosphotransferase family protein n=1 Tax=Flavobacterium plantiphilum TaxID=3163297 RepID=A0ABW8XVQ8_9FLAO
MKKLGVVITDGVGFRNFIWSDFLVEAENIFDEVVILSCLPQEVYTGYVTKSRIQELEVFEEKFPTWFFRKAKEVAHLKLHQKNNFGIQDSLRINHSKLKTPRGYATRFIFKLTSVLRSEKWIQTFNSWQQKTFKNNPVTTGYKKILEEHNFDILFFTHQRPPFIAPLVYQAEKLKIKTASFIFSWDNLASKGRMAANFDYYLVWSDLMKTELQQFYTSVKNQNIKVVGTPQFEPYVLKRYEVVKEEFVAKFNLDTSLKTICFSCGDSSTSKNDELYITTIANAIINQQIEHVNFIVRTSPAEDPVRFASFVERFPFIKWNYPRWTLSRTGHQEVWSQRIPSVEDVKDLRGLLEFSDLNINMLSTMSLDFMVFDKPVINTVFGNPENGLYNDQRFLNYAHIVNVVNSKATKIVKDQEELITAINQYLENPNLDSENRKQLLQLQLSKPLLNTGKRIAQTLLQWA